MNLAELIHLLTQLLIKHGNVPVHMPTRGADYVLYEVEYSPDNGVVYLDFTEEEE